MRRRALRLLALVVTLSAVPIALMGIPTVRCPPPRTEACHAVSYPRLGVMVLLVVLGVLLWGITEAEGDGAAGVRPRRGGSEDPP